MDENNTMSNTVSNGLTEAPQTVPATSDAVQASPGTIDQAVDAAVSSVESSANASSNAAEAIATVAEKTADKTAEIITATGATVAEGAVTVGAAALGIGAEAIGVGSAAGIDWAFWVPLISIIVLICFSGFFSGSETALTAASKARMYAMEKEGNKRAAMVNKIRERKDRMIGALLLGNNLVNIMASALATSVFIKMVGEAGIVYATLVMTLIVLIFAEVLPKTYALKYSDNMAMKIAPIISIVVLVFSPITEMVTKIVNFVLSRLGVDMDDINEEADEEELRGVIEMHSSSVSGQGVQNADERKAMLRSILDLAEVEVNEIMTHRKNVVTIDIDLPLSELIETVLDCPYTRIPVWKDNPDNVVGVIHAKQLLREVRNVDGDFKKLDVTKIALDPWFVPDTTNLFDQLQAFRERKEHFALVVDEYGSTMGIVTLEDILEEIVGEIDDEHDINVPGVRMQADGAYLVEGQVTIRDLNRAFDWNLPDEDYSTIAGLILYEAKMIPESGQAFSFYDFRFKIVKRLRHQISLIRVYAPSDDGETESNPVAML